MTRYEATTMAVRHEIQSAFDDAQVNLRRIRQYLTASPEAADDPLIVTVSCLCDVAEPLCGLWRQVTGNRYSGDVQPTAATNSASRARARRITAAKSSRPRIALKNGDNRSQ